MAWTKNQQLAIDEFGKNIIVSAGAGSGKTAVLSERVLSHIKNNIDIEDLLILTFTNAAAQEMKERIRNKLLKNNLKEQADKVDLAYITTFDSYALTLVKKYSYTLNLGKNINIIDSSIIELKKKEILNNIFEDYYLKEDKLFLKLIDDFCLKDDKEIFNTILNLNKQLDNKYNKKEYLNNYVNNYFSDDNINRLIDDYLNIIFNYVNIISLQLDNIKHYTDDKFMIKISDVLYPLFNAKTYNDVKLIINNINLPRLTESNEESSLIKKKITSLIEVIKELTKYNDLDELQDSILNTKDYILIIIKIILELDDEIFKYKISNNAFEFIDISKLAIDILKNNNQIAQDLKNKYKEILIDEYQDTNDLQDIFISLIENNNTYVVGDIKQSIYRFRNANPMLFKNKYDAYSVSKKDMKIDLNKNFRSRQNVIDGINLIFNLIMDDKIGGASYFDEHQMIFGQENYLNINKENYDLEILNYEYDKNDKSYSKTEIEIFTIANDIKNKIKNNFQVMDKDNFESRNIKYGDFAILIDRTKHFNLYKKIFEYLNIPINIVKNQTITDCMDIQLLKNIYSLLLKIYNKNYDVDFKYSFVSIARSYLFELSDDEILSYFVNNNFYDSQIYKICNDIVTQIDELSNIKLYELIIDKFDIYNKLPLIGDVNNHLVILDYIYNLIDSISSYGYTFIDFYNYLSDIFDQGLDISVSLNNENKNSVQVMTIHASKGLEFPICYFPSLDEKFNIGDLKNKIYYSNNYDIVLPYYKDGGLHNTFVKELLKSNYYEEEISEKIRLFYVALSRAREKIIFVGSLKDNILSYKDENIIDNNTRISYRSFLDILNSIYKYIKKYIINIDIKSLGLTKEYNFHKESKSDIFDDGNYIEVNELDNNNLLIHKQSCSKENKKINSNREKQLLKAGINMHYVFETFDFNKIDYSNISDKEAKLIKQFIDTKILDNVINIYKEYEFIFENDNVNVHGIIDLLLEYDDYYNIVDYKLKNIVDDEYIKQLNSYKDYLKRLSNKKVNIYLYSIMDGILEKIK